MEGKRAIVVEDGPTLTHRSKKIGAAYVAAKRAKATVADPGRCAVGSIKAVYEKFPHLAEVVPEMGIGRSR